MRTYTHARPLAAAGKAATAYLPATSEKGMRCHCHAQYLLSSHSVQTQCDEPTTANLSLACDAGEMHA
eukprot:4910384-Amphidinium_carterae.2